MCLEPSLGIMLVTKESTEETSHGPLAYRNATPINFCNQISGWTLVIVVVHGHQRLSLSYHSRSRLFLAGEIVVVVVVVAAAAAAVAAAAVAAAAVAAVAGGGGGGGGGGITAAAAGSSDADALLGLSVATAAARLFFALVLVVTLSTRIFSLFLIPMIVLRTTTSAAARAALSTTISPGRDRAIQSHGRAAWHQQHASVTGTASGKDRSPTQMTLPHADNTRPLLNVHGHRVPRRMSHELAAEHRHRRMPVVRF